MKATAASEDGTPTGLASLPVIVGGPTTLGDQVYTVLEEAIIVGALQPGQRLRAEELARHFGISRIPIRETLRALDANGWIDLRPRHGAYVRSRTDEELSDLFQVRLVLEGEASMRAAERRTEEQLQEMDAFVAAGRKAAARSHQDDVGRINTEFHRLVAVSAHNTVLADLLDGLSKRVRFYFATVAPDRGKTSVEEHAELVAAIRRCDGEGAARIARAHITRTQAAVHKTMTRRADDDPGRPLRVAQPTSQPPSTTRTCPVT